MDSKALAKVLIDAFPFEPTGAQEEALHAMASFFDDETDEAVFVLKGYAGTGKTTLMRIVLPALFINAFISPNKSAKETSHLSYKKTNSNEPFF